MTAPPRPSRLSVDTPNPSRARVLRVAKRPAWRRHSTVFLPAALAVLLLLAGDRVQGSAARALRATVLYPASLVDNSIRDMLEVRGENERLRRDLAGARTRIASLGGAASAVRMRAAFPAGFDSSSVVAGGTWVEGRVVGRGRSADGRWNYLTVRPAKRDTGSVDGALDVAFTADGLVGSVVERGLGFVTVRSIAAPESAVHVLVQRTRVAGVVKAEADVGLGLRLHLVPVQEDVAVGDTLTTSGFGDVYPPDIPVGRVTRVETPVGALVRDVWVEPFARLARLEHVFLSPGRSTP